MRFNRIAAIVLRHFYLVRGSLSRLFPLFAWVAVDMVLWGFITRYLNAVTSSGLNFVPIFLGAVLLWDFFTRVMQGVTTAFFEDVWSRNFLNLFATSLSIWEYIGGLVLSSIATSLIGLIVMLALASTVFGLSFASYGIMLVPFLFVLFMYGIALGIFASAVVLRLAHGQGDHPDECVGTSRVAPSPPRCGWRRRCRRLGLVSSLCAEQ